MSLETEERRDTPSLLGVLGSVLASMFGVQSRRKHETDFVHGKPIHYIAIGLLVTLAFILAVWGVVVVVLGVAT